MTGSTTAQLHVEHRVARRLAALLRVAVTWLATSAVHTSLIPQPDTVGHSPSCTCCTIGVVDS